MSKRFFTILTIISLAVPLAGAQGQYETAKPLLKPLKTERPPVIDGRGYTVEIRIPLESIRFAAGERTVMGVFFERTINRRQEHGAFPPLDPARGYAFLTPMAPMEYFGLKRYTLLEFLPAFTFGRDYSRNDAGLRRSPDSRELSLTGKFGITPSLILDGTVNPDFSQVEADSSEVLFGPAAERRSFCSGANRLAAERPVPRRSFRPYRPGFSREECVFVSSKSQGVE